MNERCTPEQRRIAFNNSSARLQRLIELNAPDVILSHEVQNIWRKSWYLFGPIMATTVGDSLLGVMRHFAGQCCDCGSEEVVDDTYCQPCLDKIKNVDDCQDADA